MLALAARALPQSTAINLLQGTFRPQVRGYQPVAEVAPGCHAGGRPAAAAPAGRRVAAAATAQGRTNHWMNPSGRSMQRRFPASLRAAMRVGAWNSDCPGAAGDANQPGELMHVLAALSAARQNVPVVQLESLSFHRGSAQMKLGAPDAATLAQFGKALQAGGYAAQVTSGAARGTGYEGQIEAKSADARSAAARGVPSDARRTAALVRLAGAARPADAARGWHCCCGHSCSLVVFLPLQHRSVPPASELNRSRRTWRGCALPCRR